MRKQTSPPSVVLTVALLLVPAVRAQDAPADSPELARNRLVRVVTVSQDGISERPGKAMLDATMGRLEQASSFDPDIACLPETFTRGEPETAAGPTVQRVAAWARKHACYVICPLRLRDGDRIYNSALLIDRTGEVIGRYDKIRPTEGELKGGICPGTLEPAVHQTDFGVIGLQICFDVNWHEQWRRLKQKGAEIVFFASAYPAARQIGSHAWLHQYFVVSATKSRAAGIYDISGDTIASSGKYRQWAQAVLPLGKRLFEIDFHVSKMRQIEKKYGSRIRVDWYHDDDLCTLASLDSDLTVEDLIEEFELTPHSAYMKRAQKAQDAARPSAND